MTIISMLRTRKNSTIINEDDDDRYDVDDDDDYNRDDDGYDDDDKYDGDDDDDDEDDYDYDQDDDDDNTYNSITWHLFQLSCQYWLLHSHMGDSRSMHSHHNYHLPHLRLVLEWLWNGHQAS